MRVGRVSWLLALALAAASCSPGPQPVVAGDACARCRMPVADERWGAELITPTGVVRKYDAIECLARDLQEGAVAEADVGSLWVVPFDAPRTLVAAHEAVFLQSDALRSPMGMNLAAFSPDTDRAALVREHGGTLLDWPGVLELVAAQPAGPGHAHDASPSH